MRITRRTSFPRHSDYTKYKSILREDFLYCCAYCGSHESIFGALRYMTIDHFRPKSRFLNLRTEYANLYYCCGECNTYKGDRWPSDAELAADLRFVDVCSDDLFAHIGCKDGKIIPLSTPGRFTVQTLRLDRPQLTCRNRDIARRFAVKCDQLHRVEVLTRRLVKIDDPSILLQLDDLRRELLRELHDLIFPVPLVE